MSDDGEKKKFWGTGFGKFLTKTGKIAPELLTIADAVVTGGKVSSLIGVTKNILEKKAENDAEAAALLAELQLQEMAFEKEMFALEVQDRSSARTREVELKKAGGNDWLMNVVGVVVLLSFIFMQYVAVFVTLKNDSLTHQMIGIVEGLLLAVGGYYFGTSAGSKRKTEIMGKTSNQ